MYLAFKPSPRHHWCETKMQKKPSSLRWRIPAARHCSWESHGADILRKSAILTTHMVTRGRTFMEEAPMATAQSSTLRALTLEPKMTARSHLAALQAHFLPRACAAWHPGRLDCRSGKNPAAASRHPGCELQTPRHRASANTPPRHSKPCNAGRATSPRPGCHTTAVTFTVFSPLGSSRAVISCTATTPPQPPKREFPAPKTTSGTPRCCKAAAHMMQGSSVTYKRLFRNRSGPLAWRQCLLNTRRPPEESGRHR